MATIRDVAEAAGVGIGTVSRALNDSGYVEKQKKERILQAARDLGYRPNELARRLVNRRSGLVGVVLPDISFPFYSKFLKYAEVELDRAGYRTVVCSTLGVQGRMGKMLDMLDARALDGLIVNTDVTPEEIQRMKGKPVVSFERLMGKHIPVVASDHISGGQMAAEELIRCGCRNVMILGARHITPTKADARLLECSRRLQEQQIRTTVVEMNGSLLSYPFIESILEQYLDLYTQIDGFFSEDVCAYECLKQAKKRGIPVPERLKIVGYDGNEITRMSTPGITTIAQNPLLLASTCVQVLESLMAGEMVQESCEIPVHLEKGGTT